MTERPPVVVAYDGSELAKAALRHAAELFAGRPAVLATVWEPGLAMIAAGPPDSFGMEALPDPELVREMDRGQRDHASKVATEGAELARSLGLAAEPFAVADEMDVATTLIDLARERGAAAVVVGSRGVSGLRSHLLGSVARKLIAHGDVPVLIVRDKPG
jgi:nucleotide-binding universal stress UspA family protein